MTTTSDVLSYPHMMRYGRISTTNFTRANETGQTTLRMVINAVDNVDFVNEVDLVLSGTSIEQMANMNAGNVNLNSVVLKIEVWYGSTKLDAFTCDDINTQIRTNCEAWKKKVEYIDQRLIIPLTLAPFHPNNAVFLPSTTTELFIRVMFSGSLNPTTELFGNMFSLLDRANVPKEIMGMTTYQNQYFSRENLGLVGEVYRYRLHFIHPMRHLLFWGMDLNRVRNVKLVLDGVFYYDGPIEPLLFRQRQRGFTTPSVAVISFSKEPIGENTASCVNFSKYDNVHLIIETDEVSSNLYIVGINAQTLRCSTDNVNFEST